MLQKTLKMSNLTSEQSNKMTEDSELLNFISKNEKTLKTLNQTIKLLNSE